MNCKVTFTIGGEEISLDLETDLDSPLTNEDIIQALRNNEDQRQTLCDIIHDRLYTRSDFTEVKYKDLVSREGLLGNCTLDFLREEFNTIEFPEGVDANVLLIDKLDIGKKNIHGRIITSQGKELFIVNGSKEDIQKLANFLRIRQQLLEQSFNFDESSAYYQTLQKILKERNKKKDKVGDIFQLMLDFQYNRSNYSAMYIDGQNAANVLTEIMNTILQYSGRVEYSDPFVNTVNKLATHLDNNKKFLSFDAVYGAVENFYPEILEKLDIKNKTQFKEFFSKKTADIADKLQEVFGTVVEGKEGYNTLFTVLFEQDPEFTFVYDSMSNKGLLFKSTPRSIQSKYGISYDTIHTFDIINEDYKGYKIYAYNDNGVTKYLPSRGYLTEDTVAKVYDSEEEVRQYIDSAVEKQDIKKHSFLDFKFRNKTTVDGNPVYEDELNSFVLYSTQSLTIGLIIESIDIPLVKTRIFNGEDILFKEDRQNYSSFKKIVGGWNISETLKENILSEINNAEKIAAFIYKVNERLLERRSGEEAEAVMKETVDAISTAKKRAYYIASKTKAGNSGKYHYRVIPTNPVEIENYKKQKRTPVISLMSAVERVLNQKFNIQVNMQTSEEITQNFPDIDANTSKAFVRNGEIFVNTTIADSSDLLHEYTHLVLGILKTDPELRRNYELLMYLVASKVDEKEMNKLRGRYEGISEMDLMEEMFVKKFSEYVMNNLNPDLEQVFQAQEHFLRDATRIIFNNEISDLKSFYGKTIESVFRRFSSDVSQLLESQGLDFESTKTSRYYSNWVSKQIRDGEIKEQCYG